MYRIKNHFPVAPFLAATANLVSAFQFCVPRDSGEQRSTRDGRELSRSVSRMLRTRRAGQLLLPPVSPPRLLPLRVLVLHSPRGRVVWALAAPIRRPDHTGSTRHGAREGARRGRVHALSDTSRRYLQVDI